MPVEMAAVEEKQQNDHDYDEPDEAMPAAAVIAAAIAIIAASASEQEEEDDDQDKQTHLACSKTGSKIAFEIASKSGRRAAVSERRDAKDVPIVYSSRYEPASSDITTASAGASVAA